MTGGEKLDCAIAELDLTKESDTVLLLEEIERKKLENMVLKDQVKTYRSLHYQKIF